MGTGTYGGEVTHRRQQAASYAMPLYSQETYESQMRQREGQRGFGAFGFGPRRYGWPQYGSTQYGQSQYGQPQYGSSQYGRSQYGSQDYGTAHGQSGYTSYQTVTRSATQPSTQPSMPTQSEAVSTHPSPNFGTPGRSITTWGQEQFSNQPQLSAYDRMYGPGRATFLDYPAPNYTDTEPAFGLYGRHPYGIPMGYGHEVFNPQTRDYSVDRDSEDYFRDEQRLASARLPVVQSQRATGLIDRGVWPGYPVQRRTRGVPQEIPRDQERLGVAQRVTIRSVEPVGMPGSWGLMTQGMGTPTYPNFTMGSYAQPGQTRPGQNQSGQVPPGPTQPGQTQPKRARRRTPATGTGSGSMGGPTASQGPTSPSGASGGQPVYQLRGYGTSSYGSRGYGTGSYGTSTYGTSGYSNMGASRYDTSNYGTTGYGMSTGVYGTAGYGSTSNQSFAIGGYAPSGRSRGEVFQSSRYGPRCEHYNIPWQESVARVWGFQPQAGDIGTQDYCQPGEGKTGPVWQGRRRSMQRLPQSRTHLAYRRIGLTGKQVDPLRQGD